MTSKIARALLDRNTFSYTAVPLKTDRSRKYLKNDYSDSVKYCKNLLSDTESDEEILFDMQYTDENENGNNDEAEGQTYTVEDAVEAIGLGWFQMRLYVVCGIITAADALEMLLLAVLSPVVRCVWGLKDYEVAIITTIVFTGMGLMAPLWGFIGDRYGRKKALLMIVFWIAYFGLLTAATPNYTWLLILRGLVGGGMAGSPQSFALLAEYLPSNHRAKVLIMGQTVPESARYLMAAGQTEEATKVLEKIAKENKTSLPKGHLVKSPEVQLGRFSDIFSPDYLRTTLHLWLLWFCAAFTYYGMVLASAELLRNETKGSTKCKCALLTHDDYITMIISTLGEFLCLPINMILIDKCGRKVTGMVNMCGSGLFFVLMQIHTKRWILTCIMFAVRGFASATFSWVYIYTSEVYPTSVRTLGMGTSSSWARVGAMITPFVAQVLLQHSVVDATWVYGCVCFFCGISALFLPIETKGRGLPQSVSFEVNKNGGISELDSDIEEKSKER
ncbi:hypothetical protein LOTGIDRAFT_160688 [Lottia gigantea]|uniref:Major facilitator superfamily (MFS) profile domain-containing protein n=1 Tax=Lottia gigantea TaxID=225164 RepID=V3ZVI5_LOTGI|nr:hypothetical protein LOTGIDRAFT_160688 [Lottia gigantea]ESO95523.1 hypothetical protein LOTGIDRAFT_160688 [Lottia gigantea]